MRDFFTTRLLAIDASTAFVLSETGRIVRENDPDRSPGPRLFFAGSKDGNHTHVHQRVPNDIAARVLELFAHESPWLDIDTVPTDLPAVIELLERDTPVMSVEHSIIYYLPRHLPLRSGVANDLRFIFSGTEEGAQLFNSLRQTRLPKHLIDAGFTSLAEFWTPWCAVIERSAIAALAFAARLGTQGAEIGVYTFPGWRSRGFAAAVTTSWSSHPDLVGLELFYSTSRDNRSSQRVAERLKLQCYAAGLTIY